MYKYCLLLIFLLTPWQNIYAQGAKIEPPKKNIEKNILDIGISGTFGNASSIYDANGTQQMQDSLYYKPDDTTDAVYFPYSTEFKQQSYILSCAYLGINNLIINAALPFTHSYAIEKLTYDTVSFSPERHTINEDSEFYLEGIDVSGKYDFDYSPIKLSVLGGIFAPFYKYEAPQSNPAVDTTEKRTNSKQLQLGRLFESKIGAMIQVDLNIINLGLAATYNQRTGDFTDRMLYNFHFGFTSVEKTEVYLNFNYIASLGDYKDEYKIDVWHSNLYEKYFNIDVGFKILFNQNIYGNIGYLIKLFGKNTLAENMLHINLGYIFTR